MTTTRIVLVAPEKGAINDAEELLRQRIIDLANRSQIEIEHVRSKLTTDVQIKSRKLLAIDPWDAVRIYQRAHEGPCLVFSVRAPIAMRNIRSGASRANGIGLVELLRYRAMVVPITVESTQRDVETAFEEFDEWMANLSVMSERDHRVLPLHSFNPRTDWLDLHEDSGIEAFEAEHGGPGNLSDSHRRRWKRATARHGAKFVWIAGSEIDGGVHWDVEATANTTQLWALAQLWTLPPRSYVNAYPNGTVRKGQTSAVKAKCVDAEAPTSIVSIVKQAPRRRGRKKPSRGVK